MPTFLAVLDTPATSGSPSTTDIKLLQDKIAALEARIEKCGVLVVRDHKPTDPETDGSWDLWKSEVLMPDSKVRINFFKYLSPGHSRAEWADEDEAVLSWENFAEYNPATKTYTQQIGGASVKYSKESPRYEVPNADAKFSNIRWKGFAEDGTEIGNGGGSTTTADPNNPDFLNVIQPNATLAQGRSIKKVRLFFQPKDGGDEIMYEVNL